MSRTVLSSKRKENTRDTNLGHLLIFCEGMTEKHYLEYFANIIQNNKYNDVKIEIESADGNASRVYNFAVDYLKDERNNRKYGNYKKYLVFDCDAPPNIQKIISKVLGSDDKFELLVSNYLFEVWLLMHFEHVDTKMSKKEIYSRLTNHLANEYEKASSGVIREIIQKGNLENAMNNAEYLIDKYNADGKSLASNIGEMNPYTNIHILVEELMAAIS